jgi:hypothetical protein
MFSSVARLGFFSCRIELLLEDVQALLPDWATIFYISAFLAMLCAFHSAVTLFVSK